MLRIFTTSLLVLATPILAQAQTLSQLDIYKRCYARMMNSPPPASNAAIISIKSGVKTAATACIELFDRSAFNEEGVLINNREPDALRILKTFNDLHRSWFQVRTLAGGASNPTSLIIDAEEPALYFTRAAMSPRLQFSSIVTSTTGLRGLRRREQVNGSKVQSQRVVTIPAGFPYSNSSDVYIAINEYDLNKAGTAYVSTETKPLIVKENQQIDIGQLVGVLPVDPLYASSIYGGFAQTDPDSTMTTEELRAAAKANYSASFDLRPHFGGGVIGSQAFLKSNANLTASILPNGYDLINRRVTSRVFEDLLCHQMPTLTDADVASETNAFVAGKSPHAFQQTTSCMRCHSGIDNMAFAMRNIMMMGTSAFPNPISQTVGLRIEPMIKLPTLANAKIFAFQEPTGRLHYRENFTKARKNISIRSLQSLGEILAEQNDIYYCAAKRYYHFFTGVNVDITQAPAKGSLDEKHYKVVRALGERLKSKQSVRDLLHAIFQSDAFRAWNYQTQKEATK